MKTTWASQLRSLATTLSDNGKKPISTLLLCASMGADDVATKARVRKSVSEMVKRGEFERIRDGEFNYIPKKAAIAGAHGESFRRMWRIIRTEKAGWTVQDIASTTRLHSTTVSHYCQYLEREKYIARCGKQGNTRLFRSTRKAAEQRNTPFPPSAPKDAYAKERNAACRLVRLFMDPNPSLNRAGIIDECRAILARFEKETTNAEQ